MPQLLEVMERWDGFNPVGATKINEAAAARLVSLMTNTDRLPGWKQEYLLREAVTTDDFPTLFGFTIERDLMARYQITLAPWKAYCKVGTLPNFNQADRFKVLGNDGLLSQVAERAPYPERAHSAGHYHRRVLKYGAMFGISWESIINDVLGAFNEIPQQFADSVTYTEAFNVTSLYARAAGPNNLLFGTPVVDAADGANVTNQGVLALTVANLEATLMLMASQQDANGRPLGIRGVHLVVPPALELTARAILTSGILLSTAAAPIPATNVLPQMGLQLHVDPLLPVIDTSGNRNGTWYLFADPSRIPAIQTDYLRGYEAPEVVMKSSNKVTAGGASMSPFSGSFEDDNIEYRVRCVHGGSRFDPRAAYAQVHV